MNLKNNALVTSCLNHILTVGGFVVMTLFLTFPISAQTEVGEADETDVEDLYLASGKIVATGGDKQASGPLQIKSYRVEEVTLRRPIKVEGSTGVIKMVWRLTVTIGPTNFGDHFIFLDDEPRTAVVTERNGISTIFFDAAELEDGAKISVAVGTGCERRLLSTMTTKLRMPEKYKLTMRGDADPGNRVKKIHTVPARAGLRDREEVEIQLTTADRLPVSNQVLVLQVGDLEVAGGGYVSGAENTLLFKMSLEQFSRAQDGQRIRVKFGYCSGGGLRFGKLNKAQLDQ